MSQQKNRPTPRRRDAVAAQRANGDRLRGTLSNVYRKVRPHGFGDTQPARRARVLTVINPARDRKSLKAGRLRQELAVALEHAHLGDQVIEFTEQHLDVELTEAQREWIRRVYLPRTTGVRR